MGRYRFLLSGRWIGWFLLACAAAAVSVHLAGWQMDRNDHLTGENAKIERNYDAEPLEGPAAAAPFARADPSLTWHPVRLTGRYLPEDQVLVRNRPQDGRVGYEVLVPFRTAGGATVVLDRGWVPTGEAANGMPDEVPAPPAGEVVVEARLQPGEPAVDRGAPEGQIASVDLDELRDRWGYAIGTAAYGEVRSEQPAPAAAPAPAPAPEIDSGPHLSYSLQWYAFAALFFVAYGWAARQQVRNDEWDRQYAAEVERRLARFYDKDGTYIGEGDEELVLRELEMADDMPPHLKQLMRPRPQRRRSRPTAEDEEDALLDALERQAAGD
ncbi:SURF1 family protein [Kocuria sp. LUK]|uniref:SURF1-like protein n=1 Tax=Kocuria flava TaxID=446860 RepID=A0A2N4T3U0_9MICC|nr:MULTISPECIES: SURF1 family protein [Kocuria]MCD1143977.1 SURF1 family protein [Kocuria sp. LUK]PLC12885.1 cytochrome oxidase biogenesis protein Surf1, facilitates heme A insertion [Kocuria flava]